MREVFVDNPELLQQLCEELRTESVMALDTEFLREKTYYAQLCLVQIATPSVIACIDPIQLEDISPFLKILYDPQKLKVMHSARQDLEIFSPDYLEETATLVGILALGWFDGDGIAHQGVPTLAAMVNDQVSTLEEAEVVEFHTADRGVQLSYIPLLVNQNSPLAIPLVINIIERLEPLFPARRNELLLMRNNLAWKSIVQPTG